MTTPIIIRETTKTDDGFAATVQFADGAPYPITVSDPFSEAEEKRLEWYFERWLSFPFTDKVPAAEAAASVRTYGEALFEQVFRRNPDVYYEYRQLRDDPISLEIVGSPEFHAFHWEALHDPNDERPLAVEAVVVRKNLEPVKKRAKVQAAPHLRVLLVTARPAGVRDVSYRTISRPLVEALETGRVAAQIDIVRPGTFEALVNHLEEVRDEHGDGYYHIIHLDMHGALLTYDRYQKLAEEHRPDRYTFRGDYAQTPVEPYDGLQAFLFFDDAERQASGGGDPVSADDLARLLNMRQIPVVILNACQSGKQVGAGSTLGGVRQTFTQGNLTTTNNPLDLAINGDGFFIVGRSDGPNVYTRNGQFELDKSGFIVTPTGEKLMGFQS
ncbi:MAG: flagellar hook-basal body complex protein, partial [Candidatus Eremiobacteraeota bacterium]|nr:flagellar hook-basal body complex protein [Candidatus Eremiobacteraeota bacterium]